MNSKGEYLLSQRHPQKRFPGAWECTGGSVIAGEDSLCGGLREVKEELGIDLDPEEGVLIHQKRRDKEKDFYDVWLFRKDIPIEELILQPTEVVQAKWVDKEELCRMYSEKILHPLIDYINVLP